MLTVFFVFSQEGIEGVIVKGSSGRECAVGVILVIVAVVVIRCDPGLPVDHVEDQDEHLDEQDDADDRLDAALTHIEHFLAVKDIGSHEHDTRTK